MPCSSPGESVSPTSFLLSALSSPLRMQLIFLLADANRTVSELVEAVDKSQPLVSQNLKILKDTGVVTCTRQGRAMIYELNKSRVLDLIDLAAEIAGEDPPARADS